MNKRWLSFFSALLLLAMFVTPAAARSIDVGTLQPGKFETFKQTIPINLVFIGYKGIDRSDLLGEMPKTYDPLVRYPEFYGLHGRDMGLHFDFKYRVVNTSSKFQDSFFGYLKGIGQRGPLTQFQQQYNDQQKNVLDVAGPVLYIDGPKVEKWLLNRSGDLNIDNRHSYTIYFINWYSRKDFAFHVYTKTDEPDPDTGYNFGIVRASRKMIAWGGTYSRSWFYDLSAGPEATTGNWNVDTPDLDGNGVEDYRMPPIWEYRDGGYRAPSKLASDLGLVARYVGIDVLFTPSPLYDPLLTAPGPGGRKIANINLFEDDPNSRGIDFMDTSIVRQRLRQFEPYYSWRVDLQHRDPIDPATARALRIFSGVLAEDDCWNEFGDPQAELLCYFDADLGKFVPEYRPNDYVGEIFAFNTTADTLGPTFGLLGRADDDWRTGSQTHIWMFGADEYRELGYGMTNTAIHEYGHHVGLSHPHDGYDSEAGVDFFGADATYFVWSGDESHSVMHYLALTNEFGQFNRDSMYRWETAGYLNWSNALLGDILASKDADKLRGQVESADHDAKAALEAFKNWNYLSAVRHARQAYEKLRTAADRLGVAAPNANAALRMLPNPAVPHEGDPIRFPND